MLNYLLMALIPPASVFADKASIQSVLSKLLRSSGAFKAQIVATGPNSSQGLKTRIQMIIIILRSRRRRKRRVMIMGLLLL